MLFKAFTEKNVLTDAGFGAGIGKSFINNVQKNF
jgi:hypothetical protein